MTPEAVKIWVADVTDMPMSKFTRCSHVNSGVSITCTDDLARTECLEKLRKKAITVDEAIDGVNYVISGVPSSIITHQGERDIKPLLWQEIEAATRCKVIRLASAKSEGTHFVTLPNEVRPFRIFGSKPARMARDRTEVWQCENCHGFHHTRACWGKTRCICGLIGKDHACDTPMCPNCLGPNEPRHLDYPGRPRASGGVISRPTAAQTKIIKQTGRAARRKIINDKKAKEATEPLPLTPREQALSPTPNPSPSPSNHPLGMEYDLRSIWSFRTRNRAC